jgi:hypothetical protein
MLRARLHGLQADAVVYGVHCHQCAGAAASAAAFISSDASPRALWCGRMEQHSSGRLSGGGSAAARLCAQGHRQCCVFRMRFCATPCIAAVRSGVALAGGSVVVCEIDRDGV